MDGRSQRQRGAYRCHQSPRRARRLDIHNAYRHLSTDQRPCHGAHDRYAADDTLDHGEPFPLRFGRHLLVAGCVVANPHAKDCRHCGHSRNDVATELLATSALLVLAGCSRIRSDGARRCNDGRQTFAGGRIMKSLMQAALGNDWNKLPPALQGHYRAGKTVEVGYLDIRYPRFMQIPLNIFRLMGALVNRRGEKTATTVAKWDQNGKQVWTRVITYPDGKAIRFNSYLVSAGGNQLIEFVNPVLGLQMAVHLEGKQLHYRGVRFVAKLGRWRLPIPEWLALGHTSIIETALDETHFAMDFRLTHWLFGEIFRYAGSFEVAGAARAQHFPDNNK